MSWGDFIFWPFTFSILLVVVTFIIIAFCIWMIVDCLKRKFRIEAERWIWIGLIIVTRGIGALIYYIAVKEYNPKGIAKK